MGLSVVLAPTVVAVAAAGLASGPPGERQLPSATATAYPASIAVSVQGRGRIRERLTYTVQVTGTGQRPVRNPTLVVWWRGIYANQRTATLSPLPPVQSLASIRGTALTGRCARSRPPERTRYTLRLRCPLRGFGRASRSAGVIATITDSMLRRPLDRDLPRAAPLPVVQARFAVYEGRRRISRARRIDVAMEYEFVDFDSPAVYDQFGGLGEPVQPFRVWACEPARPGSCDPSLPSSDLRLEARSFCRSSSRVGNDRTVYHVEGTAHPGGTTTAAAGEPVVRLSNGFRSRGPATVFAWVRCQRP
jgi:hypothetical protein